MTIELKKPSYESKELMTVPFEMKAFKEDEEFFYFEGYLSTFGNEDRGGDVVEVGAFDESLLHPDFKANMHVIWDLSVADVGEVSADQLMEIVEYIRSNIDERGADYKIVLVAPVDLSFGISRMFESYGNDLPVSIHIHRNIDEAFNWIEN